MKKFKLSGFGDEEFYRECPVCKNDNEYCNFCIFIPIDKSKHKHQFNCEEQIYDPNLNWFQKKILGKKEITIIKKCVCGKVGGIMKK